MRQVLTKEPGNTPLIPLPNMIADKSIHLYIKMESMNLTGSAKDRSAHCIIEHALQEGLINEETTVVESSSGNFGIAMARVCRNVGLRFICVCDNKTTKMNRDILKAYGAEVEVVTERDKATGEYLPVRLRRVQEIMQTIPDCFHPDQYANLYNSFGHQKAMQEIAEQLADQVDYVFCAVSTFGTIRGYADYIHDHHMQTKIIAVDAVGSMLFDTQRKKRSIPGLGAACVPELFDKSLADDFVLVDDRECVDGCRYLARKEGILAGGSTGGIVSAILKYQSKIKEHAHCVFTMHDKGERYLDTLYSDEWVEQHIKQS